jgi:uncharacterized protein
MKIHQFGQIGVVSLTVVLSCFPVAISTLGASTSDLRLIDAVKRRDIAAVRNLLQKQLDINTVGPEGATALSWAADQEDIEAAKLLIGAGANANVANEYGATPLWLACAKANLEMAKLLLDAGADPNITLVPGETPLMAATETHSTEIVRLLLEHGANVDAAEFSEGQTALMWAVVENQPSIVQELIKHSVNVNEHTRRGFTPLHFAAQQGSLESAKMLLAAGARIDDSGTQASQIATPLLIASASGHNELSMYLVDEGADPSRSDKNGFTSLHYAAMRRNMLPLIAALLKHGANPNVRLPRDASDQGGVTEMSIEGATPLFLAAAAGNGGAIRQLVAAGGDPKLPTAQGTTPLMVASGLGLFENRREDTVKPALEAVKLLIEMRSDVNAIGEHGWTALHGAAYTGSNEVLEVLIKNGARMDVVDGFGQTPLSIAQAVVTRGVVNDAYKRARAYRRTTSELLIKLGAPSLEASGVQVLQSLPEDFSTVAPSAGVTAGN